MHSSFCINHVWSCTVKAENKFRICLLREHVKIQQLGVLELEMTNCTNYEIMKERFQPKDYTIE